LSKSPKFTSNTKFDDIDLLESKPKKRNGSRDKLRQQQISQIKAKKPSYFDEHSMNGVEVKGQAVG